MKNRESEEMYLETILTLYKERGAVRSIDIAEELNYARSSVSRAVNLLLSRSLITIDKNGNITLTKQGLNRANAIYERHNVITKALLLLGADKESAEDNACKIEHVISDDILNLIKNHIENYENK